MAIMHIDVSKVVGTITSRMPTRGDIKKIKDALGVAARNEWIAVAGEELKSTSRDYIGGIQQPEITNSGVMVQLLGVLPNMVEQGWAPHDLRATVLRSPKAKTSKEGHKYMAVPFRHGTPGTTGRNVGREMPKAIHKVARHLAPHMTVGVVTMKGKRLQPSSRMGKAAKEVLTKKERSWHSASIYLGMIRKAEMRTRETGKKKGEHFAQTTGYSTFRTISENVRKAEQHWMHPGIRARRIATKVGKHIREIANSVVIDAIR